MLEIKYITHTFRRSAVKTWIALFFFCVVSFFMGVVQVAGDSSYPIELYGHLELKDHVHSIYHSSPIIADVFTFGLVGSLFLYLFIFYTSTDQVPLRLILRRFLWIFSIMYLLRMITLNLTIIPISKQDCELASAHSVSQIFLRALMIPSGKPTCSGQIFSGHTTALIVSTFFLDNYVQIKSKILRWLYLAVLYSVALVGIFFIIIGRYHYTVDTVVAVLIAYGVYNTYHSIIIISQENLFFHLPNPLFRRPVIKTVQWMDSDK